eukprot:6753405-Prymnesium_polylepis.1
MVRTKAARPLTIDTARSDTGELMPYPKPALGSMVQSKSVRSPPWTRSWPRMRTFVMCTRGAPVRTLSKAGCAELVGCMVAPDTPTIHTCVRTIRFAMECCTVLGDQGWHTRLVCSRRIGEDDSRSYFVVAGLQHQEDWQPKRLGLGTQHLLFKEASRRR